MKLKNILKLVIVCIASYTCTNSNKNDGSKLALDKTEQYKEDEKNANAFLSKNNYVHFIDTAKWYLYNYYCNIKIDYLLNSDSFYLKFSKEKHAQYLAALDLKVIEAHIDTANENLYLGVFFFINDSTVLIGNLGNSHGSLPDGVVIDLKTNSFSGFTSENMNIRKARPDSKEYEPFTTSVNHFIDSNLSLLHPSYLSLLKRMKILK